MAINYDSISILLLNKVRPNALDTAKRVVHHGTLLPLAFLYMLVHYGQEWCIKLGTTGLDSLILFYSNVSIS